VVSHPLCTLRTKDGAQGIRGPPEEDERTTSYWNIKNGLGGFGGGGGRGRGGMAVLSALQ
jgi:hypothetical protein